MLEVGKRYMITMIEDEAEGPVQTTFGGVEVVEIQWPIVKFAWLDDKELIINLASLYFVKAEPRE